MQFRRVVCLLILFWITAISARSTQAQSPNIVVVYVDGDSLYEWHTGASPKMIAQGKITQPQLSPDTSRVVYRRDGALWVVATTGGQEQSVVNVLQLNSDGGNKRFILNSAWLDSHTLIFNTFLFRPNWENQQQYTDDLWRVDVSTTPPQVSRLLDDGFGGNFVLSPNGTYIAVVQVGNDTQPANITLYDAQGKNPSKLLTFPTVNTASSTAFYATPQWNADSTALWVAIPDPNLVYATDAVPLTTLWQLNIDGTTKQLGSVRADFFGLPQFSPDGKKIAYIQRVGALSENKIALHKANVDGSGDYVVTQDSIGKLELGQWLPSVSDGYLFTHGNAGEIWYSTTPDHLQRFPNNAEPMFNLHVAASGSARVYTTTLGGGDLRYGTFEKPDGTTIAKLTAIGDLDVR